MNFTRSTHQGWLPSRPQRWRRPDRQMPRGSFHKTKIVSQHLSSLWHQQSSFQSEQLLDCRLYQIKRSYSHGWYFASTGLQTKWARGIQSRATSTSEIFTFKNRWMRPTGNWSPALTEREVGFLLSPFFEDIVPLAPLPESPLPDSPLAPFPDMFKLSMRFYRLFVEERWLHCRRVRGCREVE